MPSQLGDLKPEDLSGPEALLNPGKLINTFSVAYDEQIASSQMPSQLGDLKPEDLSGPEGLLNPGKLINTLSARIFTC